MYPHKHCHFEAVGAAPHLLKLRVEKVFERNVAPFKTKRAKVKRRAFKGHRAYAEREPRATLVFKRRKQFILRTLLHLKSPVPLRKNTNNLPLPPRYFRRTLPILSKSPTE